MNGDIKKGFTQRSIQAREKAIASASKTTLTDTERIDALEDAVLALSAAVPEAAAHMEKLYGNMVKLEKIGNDDIPKNVKPGLKDGSASIVSGKEAST